MKYSELIAELKTAGCYFLKHGGNHDMWYSPITEKRFPVPRHQSHEVPKETEKAIKRQAGI
jgi:mRNA interferase HicA